MTPALLDTAEYLLDRPGGSTPADISKAVSTIYYALFHCLAKTCADLFIGSDESSRSQKAWNHLYRSLSHTAVEKKCSDSKIQRFPKPVQDFARFFSVMQWKREKCDYGYRVAPNLSLVRNDLALARLHIDAFSNVDEKHRRAFAVFVMIEKHRHEVRDVGV